MVHYDPDCLPLSATIHHHSPPLTTINHHEPPLSTMNHKPLVSPQKLMPVAWWPQASQ